MFSNRSRLLLPLTFAFTAGLVVTLAQAQNGSVTTVEVHGQVRFTEGGTPAYNVLVRLESFDGGGPISEAFTDRLGKFQFSGLPPAQYSIKVHHPGFRDAQQNVDLQTSSSGFVMLQLSKDNMSSSSTTGSIDARTPPAAQKEFDKGVAALASSDKKNIATATSHFQKAIAIYPQFVEARLKLGTAWMDLAQWEKAEQALLATVDIDPKAANAFFALGEVYLWQNKLAEAENVLTKGLAIDDHSYVGHLSLARVNWEKARPLKDLFEAKPNLEKSYEQVKRSLELNPNLAPAHLLKGNLLLRVARPVDALIEFDEYLRLEPNGAFANETRTVVDKIRKATAHQTGRG